MRIEKIYVYITEQPFTYKPIYVQVNRMNRLFHLLTLFNLEYTFFQWS